MAQVPTHEDALQIESFKSWLKEYGAENLAPTNEWEALRYASQEATSSGTMVRAVSIIYRNAKGLIRFTGHSARHYMAFSSNLTPVAYLEGQNPDLVKVKRNNTPQQIEDMLRRDGPTCFFCGQFFDEDNPPTREHLVPLSQTGPNRLSNMVLAHQPCNLLAGSCSVMDKVWLRDHLHDFLSTLPLWAPLDMEEFKIYLETETNWVPGKKVDPEGPTLLFAPYEEERTEETVTGVGGYSLFPGSGAQGEQ